MKVNIINAIINLIKNPVTDILINNSGRNRANNAGDGLEEYVKDIFANSFNMKGEKRLERISKIFSYLGNNSNPPDAMLRGGDAIEVKKIESDNSSLALNSSYPKHTLKSSSPMISLACKNAEKWTEKDIIYIVGVINENKLKHLSFVYGLDYCASEECYSRYDSESEDYMEAIIGCGFSAFNAMNYIYEIDNLGVTYIDIQFKIKNPWQAFDYVYNIDINKNFTFMCIINDKKWNTFRNTNKLIEIATNTPALSIKNVKIKAPDNPAQLNEAKLISFYK